MVEDSTTTLRWSTSGANTVMVEPINSHAMTGSRTIEATPKKSSLGPVNENIAYTLTASNACGGTTTQTAMLHVTGSIDPPPPITIGSVFYPTAYPRRKHPEIGLVSSEAHALADLAANFDKYANYKNGAKLKVVAHADVRGSKKYNQALTQRRAARVKDYLVAQGIPGDKITSQALGKGQQLNREQVQALLAKNPAKEPKWMMPDKRATWLAYNRRVDIVLEPAGQQSTEMYPDGAPDARILWSRKEPSLKSVEAAAKLSTSALQARASTSGK